MPRLGVNEAAGESLRNRADARMGPIIFSCWDRTLGWQLLHPGWGPLSRQAWGWQHFSSKPGESRELGG